LALKLILLTGQRPGEVSNMAWADIDGDVWIIPEGKSKTEGNRVPLLPMAQEVLEMAKVYSGENPFVFPSSHNEGRPMTVRALSNAIRRHRSEIGITEHFSPHDLRRSLRTLLAQLGVDDVTAEKVLGHKLQGVLGIYNRYGYDDEKRSALSQWERSLKKIVGIETNGSAKVINIMDARRHG
jgi:integrase